MINPIIAFLGLLKFGSLFSPKFLDKPRPRFR